MGRSCWRERSPLWRADQIRRPLLIAQGANDPRVKQAESDQIVGAMKGKNLPVTYVLYPDEGHGFARPQNATSFYAISEGFSQPVSRTLRGGRNDSRARACRYRRARSTCRAVGRAPRACRSKRRPRAGGAARPIRSARVRGGSRLHWRRQRGGTHLPGVGSTFVCAACALIKTRPGRAGPADSLACRAAREYQLLGNGDKRVLSRSTAQAGRADRTLVLPVASPPV